MKFKAKPGSKRPKPSKAVPLKPDDPRVNMRVFWEQTDWAYWFAEYTTALNGHGAIKYQTLHSFIHAKCSDETGRPISELNTQRQFLKFYLGDDDKHPNAKVWPFAKPQHWAEKRKAGDWSAGRAGDGFVKAVGQKINVLEKLESATAPVVLRLLHTLEQLMEQLNGRYQGLVFSMVAGEQEDEQRAAGYFRRLDHIMTAYGKAQALYARALGIDVENLSDLTQILAGGLMAATRQAVEGSPADPRWERLVQKLSSMGLENRIKYNLPVPNEIRDQVIEIQSEGSSDTKAVVPISKAKFQ